MKKASKIPGRIALMTVIGFVITACGGGDDNGTPPTTTPTHTHNWGKWAITTPSTCTTEGVETRTCTLDSTHTGTHPIAALGHDWGEWTETTPASYITESVETRTCTRNSIHTETHAGSPPIPCTDIADLGTFLSNAPANTKDTPYVIKLNVNDISTLKTTLKNEADKYVYLDLSGSTITSIPEKAFTAQREGGFTVASYTGCVTLAGITIPEGVTDIGDSAFLNCRSLTSVIIPNSVTSIGDRSFQNCTRLTSITIPNSVTSIGSSAFSTCESITSVTIGNGVTTIGSGAFAYCHSLTSVTIPASVTSIGSIAFINCNSLTSVTFAGTIPSDGFSDVGAFPGNLRNEFYAGNNANGTPGTYTTTNPGSTSAVWTKQQ